MGGDNISITRGVVSRVDLMDYTMLGLSDAPLVPIAAELMFLQAALSYAGHPECKRSGLQRKLTERPAAR